MNKISTAIGLLNSMVCGGEQHSETSKQAINEAFEELKELQQQLTEAKELIAAQQTDIENAVERAEKAEADRESEMKNRDDAEVKLGRCYEEKEVLRQENKRLLAALKRITLRGGLCPYQIAEQALKEVEE